MVAEDDIVYYQITGTHTGKCYDLLNELHYNLAMRDWRIKAYYEHVIIMITKAENYASMLSSQSLITHGQGLYEVNPLVCSKCGFKMKILSILMDLMKKFTVVELPMDKRPSTTW
jgi:hypothetical protein